MITQLSYNIASYFVKEKIVEESDADIYRYGIETIFCSIFDILIVLFVGVIFGKILNALFFFCLFCVLRKLSDGYHAETFEKCKILMMIMMIMAMALSRMNIPISCWNIQGSAMVLAILMRNVKLKCNKCLYLLAYVLILALLSYFRNDLATLTICVFFVVAVASKREKGGIHYEG